jgi:hypothetical protein
LYLGNYPQNYKDSLKDGVAAVGDRARAARLTESNVREIRAIHSAKRGDINGTTALARRYGVVPGAIWSVVNHKTWKHVV